MKNKHSGSSAQHASVLLREIAPLRRQRQEPRGSHGAISVIGTQSVGGFPPSSRPPSPPSCSSSHRISDRLSPLFSRMQCQIVCSGCRNILVYPRGATNVCCAVCNTITSVPPSGTEVAQLICGCCRTLLMHARGASNVRCPCCDTINLVREANRVAHLDCGQCRTTLMYPYGAVSVKCTICHFITDVRMSNLRVPFHGANGATTMMQAAASAGRPPACETVLVENPMSLDANGNLVTNVVVGVGRQQM